MTIYTSIDRLNMCFTVCTYVCMYVGINMLMVMNRIRDLLYSNDDLEENIIYVTQGFQKKKYYLLTKI